MSQKKGKVAIIGADGQLGFDLVKAFQGDHDVVEFTNSDFDVTDKAATHHAIVASHPTFIVNTAAFHKVSECERDPLKSFAVNAVGTYYVAKAAAGIHVGIVFISTDYVFDGAKKVFTEDDAPRPLNVYGASKLAGEMLTRLANPEHYIIRTTGLFGVHPGKKGDNFVMQMLRRARAGEKISVVDDQFCAPTYTKDLAEKIKEIINTRAPYGVYHVTNTGGTSWYEFAKQIFKLAKLSPDVVPVKTADHFDGVQRPVSSILESRALKAAGVPPLRPLHEALQAYLDEIRNSE